MFFFSERGERSWGDFAADVSLLRPRLEGAETICNLSGDRYEFMVGLAAALLNGQTTALPSSLAPQAVAATLRDGGSSIVLGNASGFPGSLFIGSPERAASPLDPVALRSALPGATGEIGVYTSGSTGAPVRHRKVWETLAQGAVLTSRIAGAAGLSPAETGIIGTTPHQHMFGLEATVFAGLSEGFRLHRGPVFYPQDLVDAVRAGCEAGLGSLMLVTSPAHLNFLGPVLPDLPAIRAIVSATAPLSADQARLIEARGGPMVFEIYGSTETGSLAMRRTAVEPLWTPMETFRLEPGGDRMIAYAPHLPAPVPLGDAIVLEPDGRFRLLGRLGDMVRVAGKRSSLAALNAILSGTPGLRDGIVLARQAPEGDALTIFAVPDIGWTEAACRASILAQFREHADPVFRTRDIRFREVLPRNALGKITLRESLGLLGESVEGEP